MGPWTFEEFVILEIALVGLWFVLHFAINWINSKAVILTAACTAWLIDE